MTKKILVIEDEDQVLENILELLEAEGWNPIGAENGSIGIDLAKANKPDLILCDVMMPGCDGYGVLSKLRQDSALAGIPFIFLTAKAAKTDFRQGMELGADDYLTKPFTRSELLGAIATRLKKREVVQESYSSELKQAKQQLNYWMHHDSLTGLPNRLSLREKFKQIKPTDSKDKKTIAILCLGLDRFDQINDSLGHGFSDLLLKGVAERIAACVGNNDTVIRFNADRFIIILDDIEHKKDAIEVCEKLVNSFVQTFTLKNQEIFITASIGVAIYPRDGSNIDQLLDRANKAMFQSKQQGGNQYQFYSAVLSIGSLDRVALQTSLHYALERQELQVYYQPKVNLTTGQIMGAEALLRWYHPERGIISPGRFIPIAEETGLIIPIGEWVLQTACQQLKQLHNIGFYSLQIAVNISARQFTQVDFRQKLVKILNTTNLHPQFLELELTESMLVQNTEVAIRRLNALKALGLTIAIDDFGTGYSSLSYLQQFPFDILKIDQCFIRNISENSHNAAITKAIIEMAKKMELKIIAEGVETKEELEFVCQNQCDMMQGYIFSQPLSAKEFKELLISGKSLMMLRSLKNQESKVKSQN
ncbi:EAL domain-containing response regulator [Limnofasciculus baicalensis]|uniref:EAL domain-containing protein n=1 Tax=Limnofasciculus baicalensis BBK-W-15 TaxID=2699891 RepID=A0AAE3GUH8_9CYAN|nr:EAL domain-containing response regulator [Limnofasciculus baicalensis]MCP2730302.1 EAL domain-containing protein [Limnofasciculus baicalensis BBK-W-15]